MGKESIIKEFSELYIGKNPVKLTKEYYKKKHKEMFLLILAGSAIVVLCAYKDLKSSNLEGNILYRNEIQDGKEEISLQIKEQEGEWKDIVLDLYPKEVSKEELDELFLEVCKELEDWIKKENESLEVVTSDLNLIQEQEGYPFSIQWKSNPQGIVDETGKLLDLNRKKAEQVELTAVFEYEDWKKETTLKILVSAGEPQDFLSALGQELKREESNTRKNKEFYLPKEYENQSLKWRKPPGNSAVVLGFLFMVLMPVISHLKDKQIRNEVTNRKEQLQASFPQFITKLVLLLEAGLSLRGAIFQISQDYQKKSGEEKEYLYEELLYICRQMKNGLSEKEGYQLLAKRCNLPCYKKMSGLLIQHLQKGGHNILEALRYEAEKASEEEKRRMQKKGEEIGTKLLLPMMMLLGIVMVFIMVPALFSFQL